MHLPLRTQRSRKRTNGASSALSGSSVVRSYRHGISLIEVLISMFVLLFGLMGVAAIFPVGNYYVVEGEKFDLASSLAQNAFEELQARGMLRPEVWLYSGLPPQGTVTNGLEVIQPPTASAPGSFNITSDDGPGHAFVIDPLGSANENEIRFPYATRLGGGDTSPWFQWISLIGYMQPQPLLSGRTWPVRRITLPVPNPSGGSAPILMPSPVAETIFRLRDDLAVEQPDESDRPSLQRWDTSDPNGTTNDPTDDLLLRRQYKGDYSWLATIAPANAEGVAALQPTHPAYGEVAYDVSVVVFRKRDETPSNTSERFILGELLPGGELVIFPLGSTNPKEDVDNAVEDVRPGTWIALTGVNQVTGDFILKWYRILSLDDETSDIDVVSTGNVEKGRRMMLAGPDWPATRIPGTADQFQQHIEAIGVCIFPDAISVVTKPMRMESSSLWQMQ